MAHMANINSAIVSITAMITKARGKISSMDANKLLAIVGLIGALALGIGLITTLFGVALGWRINNEQKVEIATSNKEAKEAGERAANALRDAGTANEAASKADESAAKANERAQKLEHDNIQLRTDLENATAETRAKQTELATEQAKLANEQRKTAEAQRAADEARLALERHLEQVARRQEWRSLPAGFTAILSEKLDQIELGQFHGTATIVYHSQQDLEAYDFAWSIQRAMMHSGFITYDGPRPLPVESPDPLNRTIPRMVWERAGAGVTIKAPNQEPFRRRAQALANVFTEFGFKSVVSFGSEGEYVLVIVGPKP
jgi:chemotaxis protein histidine kinase CheA